MSPGPYDVITFDCYGTLIDWERGIREAFTAEAMRLGAPVDTDRVLALFAEIEPVVEAEPFRLYREVLAETARRIAARLNWPLPAGRAGFLAESLPYWRPFPDTNRGARAADERRLRARHPVQRRRRPPGVDPSALDGVLRDRRDGAAGRAPTSPRTRTSSPRAASSGAGDGSTRPRATSTMSSPPARSASRWRGSIVRPPARPPTGARATRRSMATSRTTRSRRWPTSPTGSRHEPRGARDRGRSRLTVHRAPLIRSQRNSPPARIAAAADEGDSVDERALRELLEDVKAGA